MEAEEEETEEAEVMVVDKGYLFLCRFCVYFQKSFTVVGTISHSLRNARNAWLVAAL